MVVKRMVRNMFCLAVMSGCLVVNCVAYAGGVGEAVQPNYTEKSSWLACEVDAKRAVDVFYVYPTVYAGKAPRNMDYTDLQMQQSARRAFDSQVGVFSGLTNVFAPYYRQVTMDELSSDENMYENKYFQIGAGDIVAAFEYYIKNLNNGRPFIIAGHSQGSMVLVNLLRKKFNDIKLLERMVAAYLIGYSITNDDLRKYPWMKAAQGEDDLGVIISFNTQAPGAVGSPVLLAGAICINPLTWTTTGEMAGKELNLGAVFFGSDGYMSRAEPYYVGAQIDIKSGALLASPPEKLDVRSFPEGIFHIYDYSFWYRNLQENVGVRIEAYLSKK